MEGRILALDYGKRRIGVAISDPDRTIAFPREVWEGKTLNEVKNAISVLIQEEGVNLVIIGLPLSMDGTKTAQTKETEAFISELTSLGVPIECMDERLTTAQADRTGGDDAIAAQIILKTYLDKIG